MYLIEKPDKKMNVLCSNLISVIYDGIDTVGYVIQAALAHITQNKQVNFSSNGT